MVDSTFRYNYDGKYLDAEELSDFLTEEQNVSTLELLSHVNYLTHFKQDSPGVLSSSI